MAMNPNYILVAAIDFGTTYSGYAFSMRHSFKNQPMTIHTNQCWNAGSQQLISLKTPTCLLLDANKQFDSFGYEAENKYAEIVMEKEQHNYYYFHRFKMCLHKHKDVSMELLLEDITGKPMPTIDVFTLSIMAMKDHLMSYLIKQGTKLELNDIRWVLSVPAIWTDISKQFMRESAVKVGISKSNLLLCLEPEAASIYCQYLPTDKLTGIEPGFTMAKPGTKYMIVDLGGGTADITVHEKMLGGHLKELCRATGGDCGGTCVDAEYIQLLIKIVGAPILKIMKQEYLESYLDLLRDFETTKRTIKPGSKKVRIVIPFSTLNTLCEMHLKENFRSVIKSSSFSDSIVIRGDKVHIDANVLRKLFDKTIANILLLIKETLQMESARSLNKIILVGGFSNCVLVQEAVRREFPNCTVIIPFDPGLSVLQGAVLFGHKSDVISSRISRFTYGISFNPKFDPAIHDEKYRFLSDGVWRCKNAFDKILEKDSVIPIGTVIHRKYNTKINVNKIGLKLFASEQHNPVYTADDDCFSLGNIGIDVSDSSRCQVLEVGFIFGNTELSLTVIEAASGNKCMAQFTLE
ncbi:heat shock 70 kDa protein 12A-like [Mytilus galloprovincialis]|uniref:heat shock 70 kDa protein 12A-like n=1 Tax=Mytilus galloprovincialis TaxID=29158 RepID=UPI003F7C7F2C